MTFTFLVERKLIDDKQLILCKFLSSFLSCSGRSVVIVSGYCLDANFFSAM